MLLGILLFILAIAFAIIVDLKHQATRDKAEFLYEMYSRDVDEIIRLLLIWQKEGDGFVEQLEHDRKNNVPYLNANMAAHSFRGWLNDEIRKVGCSAKMFRPGFRAQLERAIEFVFDAETRQYITNCFPNLYRR